MKQRLYLILLLVAVTLSGMAQAVGDAFYIYRNDGKFTAFFRDEVDSITYSHYDADSVYYDEMVTQLVHTQDSVYFIPLAAIDSIGFVQPETKVNSDVFPLTAEHSPYISEADTLKFSMLTFTPDSLRPKVGNIVVATADCDVFVHGIIARVDDIITDGIYYRYVCSQAYIEDVFEQLVIYTNSKVEENGMGRSDGIRRVTSIESLLNVNWINTINDKNTTTVLDIVDNVTATVTICKTLTTPFFFKLQLKNEFTTSINFTAESKKSAYKEIQFGETITAEKITIPNTFRLLWLSPKFSLYGYFEEQGKVELKYGGHFNRTDLLSFTYTQGKWDFSHKLTTDADTDVAQLSMDGSAEIGLKPQIDFSLNGQQAGFGLSGRLGLKESANFVFDMTRLSDGGLYSAMRDSYCRRTIPWSINVHANARIFSRYDGSQSEEGPVTASHTFAPHEEPRLGPDRYIFPLFNNVEGAWQGNKIVAKAAVSRTILTPVQVGFSLIDDDDIVSTIYDDRSYAGNTFNYSCEFSEAYPSDNYTVRPSIKLFGYNILASPSADIKNHSCPDSNHPHWIDLGLPSGTQWRCCNEGASTPEAYGGYYKFGQVSTAPTLTQIQELVHSCKEKWTTYNGVEGLKFIGPNGATIFLPAAGYRWNNTFYRVGDDGQYWSSTPRSSAPSNDDFYILYFASPDLRDWLMSGENFEYPVRPVR